MNVRAAAAKVLDDVIRHGRSLSTVLPHWLTQVPDKDRALLQELCFGVLRWYERLDAIAKCLLKKPLKPKDNEIYCLMLIGLYQLIYLRVPDHAAVSETVAAVTKLKKPWARGLTNALLRNFQRQQEEILGRVDADEVARYAHPEWLLKMLQAAYPDQWASILEANNQYPPMCLRVNARQYTVEQYQQLLPDAEITATATPFCEQGLMLEQAVDVERLPGFEQGGVSVQDAAAQLAAGLLDAQADERILDACAAPGGKTAHVLELQPELQAMLALDSDEARLQRVSETLQRLSLKAMVKHGDAAMVEQWWDGQLFDRIMLDAPCSATGVIRRHPDIKVLRWQQDIKKLVTLQAQILRALWPLLKPGGMLLYVTCSVLPEENSQQLQRFCAEHPDAHEETIEAGWGMAQAIGRQVLPGENKMDGFFYARLRKDANASEG